MKIETTPPAPKRELGFPKLMKSDRIIILAISWTKGNIKGVCLTGNAAYPVGHYSETWNPLTFRDYDGTITLSND